MIFFVSMHCFAGSSSEKFAAAIIPKTDGLVRHIHYF